MQTLCRKSTLMRAIGTVCLVVLSGAVSGSGQEQVNRSLRILYAGRPGSDREKDFVGFLKKHFDVVQTGDLQRFQEADTQRVDVTILDYDGDGLKAPLLKLSPRFSRPLLTVGVVGARMCRQWGLKTCYM